MSEVDYEVLVRDYVQALKDHDLDRCMGFYSDEAVLYFGPATLGMGKFRGRDQIEQWHKDRFQANIKITEVEEVEVEGNQVTVFLTATTDRLAAVNIDDFRAQATAQFEEGRIREVRLGLRRGYRFHI